MPKDGAGVGKVHQWEGSALRLDPGYSIHEGAYLASREVLSLGDVTDGQVSEYSLDLDVLGTIRGGREFAKLFRPQPNTPHTAIDGNVDLDGNSPFPGGKVHCIQGVEIHHRETHAGFDSGIEVPGVNGGELEDGECDAGFHQLLAFRDSGDGEPVSAVMFFDIAGDFDGAVPISIGLDGEEDLPVTSPFPDDGEVRSDGRQINNGV